MSWAVIGAGPSGLAAARAFARDGVPFVGYERHAEVGGIWDIDNDGSPMYESAHFISSKTMSALDGLPFPDAYPDYPSHPQLLNYLRALGGHQLFCFRFLDRLNDFRLCFFEGEWTRFSNPCQMQDIKSIGYLDRITVRFLLRKLESSWSKLRIDLQLWVRLQF